MKSHQGNGSQVNQRMPSTDEIEERARRAYFRLYGPQADQPGWVEVRGKNVTIGNVRGPLTQFRIVKRKQGVRLDYIDNNQEAETGKDDASFSKSVCCVLSRSIRISIRPSAT